MVKSRLATTLVALIALAGVMTIVYRYLPQSAAVSGEDVPNDVGRTATRPVAGTSPAIKAGPDAPLPRTAPVTPGASMTLTLGDPLQDPKDPAELDWLQRHGYPSKAQLDYGIGIRGTRRDLDMNRPATPEKVVQASVLADGSSADADYGRDYLLKAAMEGSTYALQELGNSYALPPHRDPLLQAAYFKAASLRGDWSQGIRPEVASLGYKQQMMTTLMAHQIIENLNRARASHGLPPYTIVAHPGLDAFLQAFKQEMAAHPP